MKLMRNVASTGFILAFCGTVIAEQAASAPAAAGTGASAVKAAEPSYDFGKAWAGDAVSHTFKLTNPGGAPLAIKNVSAGCGCTVIKDYSKSVAPGSTWELPATFNTKGQSGRVTKTITVYFADAKYEPIRFAFTGEVRVRYKAEPLASFQFGRIKGQAVETRAVTITNQLDTPLELRNARVSSETFFVNLREIEKGKQYEVAVATVPPLKEGALAGKVFIDTNMKDQPQIELPIGGFIPPRLGLTPSSLSVPTSRPSESRNIVTFRNDGETLVHVKEVRASNPTIKTEVKTVFDGKLYQIVVTLPRELALGGLGNAGQSPISMPDNR
jgi:hypothetical protein